MMRDRVWFTIKRDFLPIRTPSYFLANVNTEYRGENCKKFICKSYFVGSKERISNVDIRSVDFNKILFRGMTKYFFTRTIDMIYKKWLTLKCYMYIHTYS